MTDKNKEIPPENSAEEDDRPPLFKSWSGWYILLVGTLSTLILLFYLFTRHYS